MSVREVRRWRIRCDWCGKVTEVQDEQEPSPTPPGGGTIYVHGCGLTDYTRTDRVCADCLAKRGLKDGDSI